MAKPSESLAESFPKEQERLVGLLEAYIKIGPSGAFGLEVIRQSLFRSFAAVASGDIAEMLASYLDMKDRR